MKDLGASMLQEGTTAATAVGEATGEVLREL